MAVKAGGLIASESNGNESFGPIPLFSHSRPSPFFRFLGISLLKEVNEEESFVYKLKESLQFRGKLSKLVFILLFVIPSSKLEPVFKSTLSFLCYSALC